MQYNIFQLLHSINGCPRSLLWQSARPAGSHLIAQAWGVCKDLPKIRLSSALTMVSTLQLADLASRCAARAGDRGAGSGGDILSYESASPTYSARYTDQFFVHNVFASYVTLPASPLMYLRSPPHAPACTLYRSTRTQHPTRPFTTIHLHQLMRAVRRHRS